MRKLCSHPALVLDPQQPAHVAALNAATGAATEGDPGTWEARVAAVRSQLHHAPKLEALQQLLQVTGHCVSYFTAAPVKMAARTTLLLCTVCTCPVCLHSRSRADLHNCWLLWRAQLAALAGAGDGQPGGAYLMRPPKPCSTRPSADGMLWLSGRAPSRIRALAGQCELLLLQACGIGSSDGGSSASSAGDTGPPHRVLVFAQLRNLLDIVEADVLQAQGITYLRLDGR